MAYYADLTPYEYEPDEPGIINVGWLSVEQSFQRGPVPYIFAVELERLAKNPVTLCRGFHYCEFCKPPEGLRAFGQNYLDVWAIPRRGNGEVRVTAASGIVYAAPSLIWHYVVEHQYQPPQEFIRAVLFQMKQFDAASIEAILSKNNSK
jgi:hypothetical protein